MHFDRLINKVLREAVDPFAQLVILKQVVEGQDRGIIWESIAYLLDAGKAALGRYITRASSIAGSLSKYHWCNR